MSVVVLQCPQNLNLKSVAFDLNFSKVCWKGSNCSEESEMDRFSSSSDSEICGSTIELRCLMRLASASLTSILTSSCLFSKVFKACPSACLGNFSRKVSKNSFASFSHFNSTKHLINLKGNEFSELFLIV